MVWLNYENDRMIGGKWINQISLLTFLVVVLSLRNGNCNSTENYTQFQVTTLKPADLKRPKLLIFNLDMVIWPFRVDLDILTPVKKNKRTGEVKDFMSKPLGVYSDALDALSTLYLSKYRMAAVSDSPDVETNTKLLLDFNLYNYFPLQEFFGGPKLHHLEILHRTTQIPYQDMFYFDVKNGQLDGLRKTNIHIIEVESGLSIKDFNEALDIYNNKTFSNSITSTSAP